MELHTKPMVFRDKHGNEIKPGDILYRQIFVRRRERPGHRRVAINGMSGNETIVNDEGRLLDLEPHWITRKVGWVGACLVADRHECSDFQAISSHALFSANGERIFESSATKDMNNCFDGSVYEIR